MNDTHWALIDLPNAWSFTLSPDGIVSNYDWVSPPLVTLSRDTGGNEEFFTTISSIAGQSVALSPRGTPFNPGKLLDDVYLTANVLPEDPDRILVTAERTLVAENPGTIERFQTDQHGFVRFGFSRNASETTIWFREIIYALTDIGRDRVALVEFDPETASVSRLLYDHPTVDLDQSMLPPGWDSPALVRFEHELEGFAATLDTQFPDAVFRVNQVLTTGDVVLTIYDGIIKYGRYVYRADHGDIIRIFDASVGIDPKIFALQHAIFYQARDGRTIHGYLSLPPGVTMQEASSLPTVIYVHGGPWACDE